MRTLTRVLSALVGLVLLVAGLALALEVALTAARGTAELLPYDAWLRWSRTHAWRDAVVVWTGLGMLLAGVLLLVLTLRRRAPLAVPGAGRQDMTVSFARRPLEQAVARLAERSAGVEGVRVTMRRHKAAVHGASLATDLDRTRDVLSTRLSEGLDRLPLQHTPTIDVRLRKAAG